MGSLNSLIKKDEIKEPAPAPAQEPIQVPKKKFLYHLMNNFWIK